MKKITLNQSVTFLVLTSCAWSIPVSASTLDLTGPWQIASTPETDWEKANPPVEPDRWKPYALPDFTVSDAAPGQGPRSSPYQKGACFFARREFTLSEAEAGQSGVLRWELIRWGFTATINGVQVGSSEVYGPGYLAIPPKLLRAGTNELVLKVRNWESLARGGTQNWPLIPAGAAVFSWGSKNAGVLGAIQLEFHDGLWLRSVLMRPDLAESSVAAAIRYASLDPATPLAVEVKVRSSDGALLGETKQTFAAEKAAGPLVAVTKLLHYEPWTPEHPRLCTAEVKITQGPRSAHKTVTFGMRTFEARDGHFYLNGRPFTILGSNVVSEWLWSHDYYHDAGGALKRYLIDAARGMHVNAVRTHTMPPLDKVARLCDENGMGLLAEMPFTYNYQKPGFSPAEARQYHEQGQAMTLAWVEALANHPSILMWVSTNEAWPLPGFDQPQWDREVMIPAIQKLDPTRPVLRAGETSPEVEDLHCYDGFWSGAAGDFKETVAWRAEKRDRKKPLGNSEYIEGFPPDRMFHWLGTRTASEETARYYAMVGMRQTEAMRRLGYDLVLPYMLHGWTRGTWRPYAPTPMYGALKNALAPVAVSIDCDDRNFVAGTEKTFPLVLINDTNDEARGTLSFAITARDPEFDPDAKVLADPPFRQKVTLPPHSRTTVAVPARFPAQAGPSYAAAVLAVEGGEKVLSQRPLDVRAPFVLPADLARRTVRVVGCGDTLPAWFRERGIQAVAGIPAGRCPADTDILVVWENLQYSMQNLQIAGCLATWLAAGKKVVMMQQHGWQPAHWHWGYPQGPDGPAPAYTVAPHRSSLALPEDQESSARLFQNITGQPISHWNGLNNAICRDTLTKLPPATTSAEGGVPVKPGTIVIEAENPASSNFVVDFLDSLHCVQENGVLRPLPLNQTRGPVPSLLSTKTPPAGVYQATYPFSAPAAGRVDLWVFEQGRTWSSPFQWRVDGGNWQAADADREIWGYTKVSLAGTTFAWCYLGTIDLAKGDHRLEIQVTGPKPNGHYLLSQDCFLLVPAAPPAKVLARSSGGLPVLAWLDCAPGQLLVTQLLLAERLSPAGPAYDPVAEQFFANLLAY